MLNHSLLSKTNKYIVGVSGGVDSMALLDMLFQEKYNVVVCHFNYHIRKDSDVDEELVKAYCKKNNIQFYVRHGNNYEGNFEMQAREMRYTFYHDIGKMLSIENVILAHHLGDHIETIIMQIQRKNTKGYLGIQEISYIHNMQVIRPMLNIEKKELYNYCHENHIDYHEDYTNNDLHYTRNHIRHIDVHQYDRKNLLNYANSHNKMIKEKEKSIKDTLEIYHRQGELDYRNIDHLEDVIYEILKEVIHPPLISEALIKEIVKQINSSKPNIEIRLPVNFVFIKKYNNIYVRKNKSDDNYSISYNCFHKDNQKYYSLQDFGHIHDGVYLQDEDYPITIRNSIPGDKIITSGGTKKVSRLFIDNKVPVELRRTWPVLVNSKGEIVLIPHIAKNIKYLYTKPNVFVLKLSNVSEV